jgi:DNA polymerase-3 subunit gamma/tau
MSDTLYRKYRPQTFNDMTEQKVVVDALKGQIINNKIGHSYIFFGSR